MAATVVVANPLAPPSRDMQISTTQLSTSPDLLSPSDKSLLSALTPKVGISDIGPALAQILAALAADADRISREVSSAISPEAPAVAAMPEQTAYRPGPIAAPFLESANATPAPSTNFASAVVSSDVVQAINGLVLDTSYLGGKVVEAAYAVVDVIIQVPQFVINAALDLLAGDIAGAIDTVKSAIRAFWGPGLIILDGIRDVLYGRRPPAIPAPSSLKRLVASATASSGTETKPPATDPSTDTTTPTTSSGGDNKADSARKRDTAPSAASLKPSASKSANSDSDTATSTKGAGSSKPSTGTSRSKAGSARNSKSSSSASSSSD